MAYSFCAVVVSLTMVGEMKDILVRAVTLLLPLVLLDLLLELLPPPLLPPFLLPLLTPPLPQLQLVQFAIANAHVEGNLSAKWRLALSVTNKARRWVFVPALMMTVVGVVVYSPGTPVTICFVSFPTSVPPTVAACVLTSSSPEHPGAAVHRRRGQHGLPRGHEGVDARAR